MQDTIAIVWILTLLSWTQYLLYILLAVIVTQYMFSYEKIGYWTQDS